MIENPFTSRTRKNYKNDNNNTNNKKKKKKKKNNNNNNSLFTISLLNYVIYIWKSIKIKIAIKKWSNLNKFENYCKIN